MFTQLNRGSFVKLKKIKDVLNDNQLFVMEEDGLYCSSKSSNPHLLINHDMIGHLGEIFEVGRVEKREKRFYLYEDEYQWTYPFELIEDIVDSPYKSINLSFDEMFNGLDDKKFTQIRS